MPDVFIRYASAQQALAQQLESELRVKGVQAWRDKINLYAESGGPKP
jgi:hypothetical protein